ncbi:MAG: aminopeptidase P family N-terminal domain-containing protein, partial [Chloroflexota bacterium]|nr:aminopeptidase P family N-terminal domain-containing protein [Chloroflexota bacterium]
MNQRVMELQVRLAEGGMDAALLLHPRDVLYYAGTARPASLLVVTPSHPSGAAPSAAAPQPILFVRRGMTYARQEATVERVERMRGFSSVTGAIEALGLSGGVLGVELDVTPAQLVHRLTEAFHGWKVVDVS